MKQTSDKRVMKVDGQMQISHIELPNCILDMIIDRSRSNVVIVDVDDAGNVGIRELPREVVEKLVEIVVGHEKYQDDAIGQIACDIIDDAVDVWLDKADE